MRRGVWLGVLALSAGFARTPGPETRASELPPAAIRLVGELRPPGVPRYFGLDVDVDGDVAVVGAYYDDVVGATGAGSAHVFRRVAGSWVHEQRLTDASPTVDGWFGWGVTVSGDTVAISAMKDDTSVGTDSGSVHVFRFDGTSWVPEIVLDSLVAGGRFGSDIDLDGSRMVVGHYAGPDLAGARRADVFVRTGSWAHEASLTSSAAAFGRTVTISGDRLAVSAMLEAHAAAAAGRVYLYRRSGSSWVADGSVVASDPVVDDWFGYSIGIDGDRLLVMAPGTFLRDPAHVDRAFFFERTGAATWSSAGRFVVPTGAGVAPEPRVAVDGDLAMAGASTYVRGATGWEARDVITVPGEAHASAISGSTILVGTSTGTGRGSAFAFEAGVTGALGEACTGAFGCGSGFCVSGVCCDTGCGGGAPGSCSACSTALTGAANGTCAPLLAGTAETVVCRAQAGVCDVAERCSPSSITCPTDGFATGMACRVSFFACDASESCDGSSADCPPDRRAAAGQVCRPSTGPCDPEETCDGVALDCPTNRAPAPGTVCRAAAGPCDIDELCIGSRCPADDVRGTTVICRDATGPCDVAERCGGGTMCPADELLPAGVPCRVPVGACDALESCDGATSACPTDAVVLDGTACGDDITCNGLELCTAGVCGDPENIDCDDGDSCTADACAEPDGVCVHSAIAGCCVDDAGCDDADECTRDRCAGDVCEHEDVCARDASVPMDAGEPPITPDAGVVADAGAPTTGPSCGCRAGRDRSWPAGLVLLVLLVPLRRRPRPRVQASERSGSRDAHRGGTLRP